VVKDSYLFIHVQQVNHASQQHHHDYQDRNDPFDPVAWMEEEGLVPVFIRFDGKCLVAGFGRWWNEDNMRIWNDPFDVGIMYIGV
jgi:hypothetical protein